MYIESFIYIDLILKHMINLTSLSNIITNILKVKLFMEY